MKSEHAKVELDRYDDLIIAEEQLRTLINLIFDNARYSDFQKDLVVEDERRQIISYIKNCVTSAEYRTHLNQARINYEIYNNADDKGDK